MKNSKWTEWRFKIFQYFNIFAFYTGVSIKNTYYCVCYNRQYIKRIKNSPHFCFCILTSLTLSLPLSSILPLGYVALTKKALKKPLQTNSNWYFLVFAFHLICTNVNPAFYSCGCFAAFRPQLQTAICYPSEVGETAGISSPPRSVSSSSRFRVPSASSPRGSWVSFNSAVPVYGRNAHLADFLFVCVLLSSADWM